MIEFAGRPPRIEEWWRASMLRKRPSSVLVRSRSRCIGESERQDCTIIQTVITPSLAASLLKMIAILRAPFLALLPLPIFPV